MKIHLIALFFSFYTIIFSQSNITWEVKTITFPDSTIANIDSIPLINNLKEGTHKSYSFFKKGNKYLLLRSIQYQADRPISEASYNYDSDGRVSSSFVHEITKDGKTVAVKEYYGSRLIRESVLLPKNRFVNKEYHTNGKLAAEGRIKTYLSKHKGRCNADIYLTKKIGLWKYYNKNGRRIVFFGSRRYR